MSICIKDIVIKDINGLIICPNVQAMETVHIKTGASTGVNWKNV